MKQKILKNILNNFLKIQKPKQTDYRYTEKIHCPNFGHIINQCVNKHSTKKQTKVYQFKQNALKSNITFEAPVVDVTIFLAVAAGGPKCSIKNYSSRFQ